MTSTTSNLSSEELRRVRQELWSNLQEIDTRLKQTYVPPHFRITTSSTSNQRTFSTGDQSSHELSSTVKRSRVSSSSYDDHGNSLIENETDDGTGKDASKTLHSSIVTTNRVIKTKDDLISLVNRDQQSTGRNRRMFGVLLGTLNKFKQEASAYNEQTSGMKRHQIERRLEEKQAKEREDKQHERTELIASKKTYQQKLKLVNIKIEILERMKNHEKAHLPLKSFIRTKTKPYVFFLPKGSIDEVFDKQFQQTQLELEKELEDFKRECQSELDLIDDTTTNSADNGDDNESERTAKKRKLTEHDDEPDDDDDDALADLPDEITLSAPEMKGEGNNNINNTDNSNSAVESNTGSVSTRTVIFDHNSDANKQQDDQSMIDE